MKCEDQNCPCKDSRIKGKHPKDDKIIRGDWTYHIPEIELAQIEFGGCFIVEKKIFWLLNQPIEDNFLFVVDVRNAQLRRFKDDLLVKPIGDKVGFKQR